MLKERIESELKSALKSGGELKLSVMRMLSSAIHNREIEERTRRGEGKAVTLSDEEVLEVVRSEVKKRRDAASAYKSGGRPEAASREETEAEMLSSFLPAEISDEELGKIIEEGASAIGSVSSKDFGKLMGWVMGRVKGRAGGERVSALVRRRLSADEN